MLLKNFGMFFWQLSLNVVKNVAKVEIFYFSFFSRMQIFHFNLIIWLTYVEPTMNLRYIDFYYKFNYIWTIFGTWMKIKHCVGWSHQQNSVNKKVWIFKIAWFWFWGVEPQITKPQLRQCGFYTNVNTYSHHYTKYDIKCHQF